MKAKFAHLHLLIIDSVRNVSTSKLEYRSVALALGGNISEEAFF